MKLRPGLVEKIISCQYVLQEAKMEDMRVIWEVVELGHELHDWRENFKQGDGKKAWKKLVRIIEMVEENLKRDIEDKDECDGCLSDRLFRCETNEPCFLEYLLGSKLSSKVIHVQLL